MQQFHQLFAAQVPQQYMKYILPKGFIAVDGISLTVGEVGDDCFTVYLIPETLRVTTLGGRAVGDTVNLEIESQTQVLPLTGHVPCRCATQLNDVSCTPFCPVL